MPKEQQDLPGSEDEEENENDYFEFTPFVSSVVVLVGIVVYEILCFQTSSFPYHLLGNPGRRLKYLTDTHLLRLQLGFIVCIFIHLGESLYAYFLCRKLQLSSTPKWVIQTFLFGFLSLRLLRKHEEKLKESLKRR